jgi:hypothetical protein
MPERGPGKLSASRQAEYDREVADFVGRLQQSRSRLDFSPGARGWCYLLEGDGLVTKGQFKQLEYQLGVWRKGGQLPLWLVGEDERRLADNLEKLDTDSPKAYAEAYAQVAAESWKDYTPVSFWEFQRYYIEQAVEKLDLKSLFGPTCAEFHVPIVNFAGWTSTAGSPCCSGSGSTMRRAASASCSTTATSTPAGGSSAASSGRT